MDIFQQYGIKEVADVCLYAIELDENDDEIYIPVLYLDTLKVSTVEQSADQTSAQGGLGNPKLITWDYGKEISITLEDALFTPSSQAITWGGKKSVDTLKLYLRNFFDKEKDLRNPNANLRGAVLSIDQFSDFLIIPDRWPAYEKKDYNSFNTTGYAGGTSIYCWLVNGNIVSSNKDKIALRDLILFYREQTQKWYFFNGKGPTSNPETWYKTEKDDHDIKKYGMGYQYGKDTFNWIKNNLSGDNIQKWEKYLKNEWEDGIVDQETGSQIGIASYSKTTEQDYRWTEYEGVAQETYKGIIEKAPTAEYNVMGAEVIFLTQELYIDGLKINRCFGNTKYSDISEKDIQDAKQGFQPFRYNASIDVEYNTNIAPPQSVIYNINQGLSEVFYLDRIEKNRANQRFCIDTDINLKHSQYRFLNQYSETELTVYINPRTMQPYEPNAYEYERLNGQRITGNLKVFKQDEVYYKWTRTRAQRGKSLGRQIIIDATHFPGTYRLVGETFIKDRFGIDQRYQFEIPLCKMGANNNLVLQADGEPTTFTMTLTALRRNDGVMMKLTSYSIEEKSSITTAKEIKQHDITIEPTRRILMEISEPFERKNVINTTTTPLGLRIQTPLDGTEYDLSTNDIENLVKDSGESQDINQDTLDGKIHVFLSSSVETDTNDANIRRDTIDAEEKIGIVIGTESQSELDNRFLNEDEYEADIE